MKKILIGILIGISFQPAFAVKKEKITRMRSYLHDEMEIDLSPEDLQIITDALNLNSIDEIQNLNDSLRTHYEQRLLEELIESLDGDHFLKKLICLRYYMQRKAAQNLEKLS
jgi:hypothetical protein